MPVFYCIQKKKSILFTFKTRHKRKSIFLNHVSNAFKKCKYKMSGKIKKKITLLCVNFDKSWSFAAPDNKVELTVYIQYNSQKKI